MLFETPNGSLLIQINMVGFVNDSTCVTGGTRNTTFEELIVMMQKDAQLWHDLLWTSGGKLELPKCGYHIVDYEFDGYGLATKRFREGGQITLKDDKQNKVVIKSKIVIQTLEKSRTL